MSTRQRSQIRHAQPFEPQAISNAQGHNWRHSVGIDTTSSSPNTPNSIYFHPHPSLLSSRELDLFSHYITHTSRVIPSDQQDLFALHVGIPNLAFTTPAVMGAVLALSAACKCHHLVPRWTAELQDMRELLALADRHHQKSLEQLREAISASNFNAVLANAALMVLYALAAHSVRVHVALKAKRAQVTLPKDVLPFHSQWITSIRAAYEAYVGLDRHASNLMPSPGQSVTEADEAWLLRQAPNYQAEEQQHVPQDGPSEETKRLLLPLMSATYQAAMDKLRLRCQDAAPEACMASYQLLADLFEATLGNGATPREQGNASQDPGILNNAYPWLARYLARVTSARPSKLSRRSTMAFLNHVPNEFLHLVQSALDCMPMNQDQDQHDGDDASQYVELQAAHQPAMDIFAHWLVLVMLLDGVWWIGDVGRWELGRVLGFAKAQGWLEELSSGGAWWPQTMYDIKATLDGGA